MGRPLGNKQLRLLLGSASPGDILVTPDGIAQSLKRRGYLAPWSGPADKALRITPDGMRALADAYEAGLLDQFMWKRLRSGLDRIEASGTPGCEVVR